jgi:hypothetical protein
MKAFFTWILLFTTAITVSAQIDTNATDHLKFKGIPIDGTLNEFVSEMKKSGFLHLGTEDGVAIFEGDFAGFKGCGVAVTTFDNRDLVSIVRVIFTEQDTWASLISNYLFLIELLTEKYGEPDETVEEFLSSWQPETDEMKMHMLGNDECSYYSSYELKNGTIQIELKGDNNVGVVLLSYYDKINYEKIRQEALNDL